MTILGTMHRAVMAVAALAFAAATVRAEGLVKIEDLSHGVVLFKTSSGNVIGLIGSDGAILVGTPSVESTKEINKFISDRTKSTFRYVVIPDTPVDDSQGDAGWGREGAVAVMQEKALERLGGHAMGPPQSLPLRLVKLGVERPQVSFSDVICFDFKTEAVHVIHQQAGHNNSDWLAHFHVANVVYFGPVFPGDSYPDIDLRNGGSLDGLIAELTPWTDESTRIIPMWGEPANGIAVKEFLNMLMTVQDRVHRLVSEGKSEQQVQSSEVTREFDSRWGHGQVSPTRFVHEVFESESGKTKAP